MLNAETLKKIADLREEGIDPARLEEQRHNQRNIAAVMGHFRSITKNSDVAVQYQQGQHTAIQDMFCMMYALNQDLSRRVKALEARLVEVEARPTLKYMGVWKSVEYPQGSFVSEQGSLWHANKTTTAKPGTSADWTLAVKRGRDAR